MNLKMKLNLKVTAIARILNDKTAIYSDEVSPTTDDALRLIEAKSRDELIATCQKLAVELNKDTRFNTVFLLIDENNETTKFVRKKVTSEVTF